MTEAATGAYTGVANLEVMAEAVRYNAFLGDLIAAQLRPGDTVLDFGAGTGTLALPLSGSGYRVICVEPDAALRARLAAAGLTAHADLASIPPAGCDVIYTVNVLEHIEDDAGALAALRLRLKPGGRLVIYVPAFPLLYSSMDRTVGHFRRYRRRGLLALIQAAGFVPERAAYCDCLGFPAALAFRLAGNRDGTVNHAGLVAYDRYVFPVSRRLDRWSGRWFGKNLFVVARRDDHGRDD